MFVHMISRASPSPLVSRPRRVPALLALLLLRR